MGPAGIELTTPGSAVRLASVARHVTHCATRPGDFPCLADELAKPCQDMNIKVTAFTESKKFYYKCSKISKTFLFLSAHLFASAVSSTKQRINSVCI